MIDSDVATSADWISDSCERKCWRCGEPLHQGKTYRHLNMEFGECTVEAYFCSEKHEEKEVIGVIWSIQAMRREAGNLDD